MMMIMRMQMMFQKKRRMMNLNRIEFKKNEKKVQLKRKIKVDI